MSRLTAWLVAEIMMIVALSACDTFGPPPNEGVCGGVDAPCSTAGSVPGLRPPAVIPPPTGATTPVDGPACITCSRPRTVQMSFGAAGIGGSPASAGSVAVDANDADAGTSQPKP